MTGQHGGPKLPPIAAGLLESFAARQTSATVVSHASFDVVPSVSQRLDSNAMASTSAEWTGRPGSRGRGLPPLATPQESPKRGTGEPIRPRQFSPGRDRIGTGSLKSSGRIGTLLEAVTADSFGMSREQGIGSDGMQGVRNPHVSGMALEKALGQVLASLDPMSAPGDHNSPMHRLGLTREALASVGMPPQSVERLHRLLYVSTVGFSSSLTEILRACRGRTTETMRAVVQGYMALAQAVLRQTFHSEVLALADLTSTQAAELYDRLQQLAEAYTDQMTLERALASVTSAHAEEVARNKVMAGKLHELEESVDELDRRYAMTMHQYMTEAHHRADLQAEVAQLRRQAKEGEEARAQAAEAERVAREAAEAAEAGAKDAKERVPQLEAELERERGLRQAAEGRLEALEETHERAAWRQKVTHERFQEEMASKTEMQARVLRAEGGLTAATRELDALRERHRKLEEEHTDAAAALAEASSKAERLAFENEQLAAVNRALENKALDMQEALERKREKKRQYKHKVVEQASVLDTSSDQIARLRTQLTESIRAREAAEAARSRAALELDITRSNLRGTSVGFAHAVRAVLANQVARRHLQRRVAELTGTQTAAAARLAAAEKRLEAQLEETGRLEELCESLRAECDQKKAAAEAAEERARGLAKELEVAREDIKAGSEDASGMKKELEEVMRRARVAETRVEQLRDQLAQETGALRKMQERAEAAERELNLSKGTLNTVKMERAQLQGQVKDARETIKELQARVAAEQALVKDGLGREVGLKEVIAGLERQLAQSRAEMQATQEELEERTRELEEEKKGRAEDVERLYAAKVAVGDELEATSKALAEEKAGRGADVEERDQEIGRLLGLVQSLRDEVEAKTQTITYKEKRIAELHERIEKQNGALEDLRERLDEEVERNRQLNESKVYFESQVASIKAANAQLNDRHVTDEEEIKRLNQMLVEEGKVHESTVQERDRVVARAKVEVERAYRVRMLEQETRWLGSMQQAVDDLHDRESGYEALQRVFKSVELSLGDVEPLLENLKGSEDKNVQRLDERLGLVLKELEEARAVRAKYNRALRSTNYASVLEESMRRIESLKGTPDTSLEPSAASVGA